MEDFIGKGASLGVYAVDMTAYWLKSTEPDYLIGLRRLAFKNGLTFSGVAIRTEMCQSARTARAQQVDNIKKWVDATNLLGASHLRVFAGNLPWGASAQQGIEWVADTMKAACDYGAEHGVILGIEDHHGITSRADQVLEIVRRVDSPFAGINLDIENFDVTSEEERYSDIEACLPSATHIHVRDVVTKTHRPSICTACGGCLQRPVTKDMCPRSMKVKKTLSRECPGWWRRSKLCAASIQAPRLAGPLCISRRRPRRGLRRSWNRNVQQMALRAGAIGRRLR
jgi:sugar phosphate isomerase/epimerase